MEEFAMIVRTLREEHGLTQEQLAYKAGLTVRTITKIEAGEMQDPALSTFVKLVRCLDVPYSRFEKMFDALIAKPSVRKRKKK